MENNTQDVVSAFEILLEELEAEIEFAEGSGWKAFKAGEYDKIREALQQAAGLTAFRDKAAGLLIQWGELTSIVGSQEDEATKVAHRNLGKLRKGLRTPESAYNRPILEVLRELGGSGKTGDVLDAVLVRMEPVLTEVDFQPLTSEPDSLRWRNSARWARNSMVDQGLMKRTSPRGIWEISARGRAFLNHGPTPLAA